MSHSTHLVSGERSHPCVPPRAEGAVEHTVVAGRCTRCGSTVSADATIRPRSRGGWLGERVLGIAIGSGVLALGAGYLLLATERMRTAGASPLSAPAIAGAACVALGSMLVMRGIRG
jgi:hypothetical protein